MQSYRQRSVYTQPTSRKIARTSCASAHLEERAVLYPEALDDVLTELNDVYGRLQPPSATCQLDHGLDKVRRLD